jgi:hypothetical protein
MKVNINILKEHPLNSEIYGDDSEEQINELVERIKVSNWIKSIMITSDYLIISGHRRVRAAKKLGFTEIECEYVTGDADKQLEILLNENAYRIKTNSQKVNEGKYYYEIESRKAHERQIAGVSLPVSETQGRTNEIVAMKVGWSESSFKKAHMVSNKIDEIDDPALKWLLGESLNENITATANLADKPIEFMNEVMKRVEGDVKIIGKMVHQMEQEEMTKNLNLPAGKFQVIYLEYGKQLTKEHSLIPIADISENNSVLFLWSLPPVLEASIKLINGWGYNYRTAFLWNKDVMNEVSDLGEILLVATKGNPPMLFQTKEHGVMERPSMIKDMIDRTYSGSKIKITLGKGWAEW